MTASRPGPAVTEGGAVLRIVRDSPVPRASCPHCGGQLQLSTLGSRWQIHRPSDVADRMMLQLGGLEREELHVLSLNAKNVVIGQERVYAGNVSAALVRVGELFAEAVRRQARSVILCHNHPSHDPTPSPDDLALTVDAIAAGRLLDVDVLDHLIIGGTNWVSLRANTTAFDHLPERRGVAEGQRTRADLHVDADGRVVDDAGAVYDLQAALDALSWTTALKSSGAPHQYAIRGKSGPPLAWDVLATAIRRHPDAYMAYHRGMKRPTRYLEDLGWRLWCSSAWNPGGTVLFVNRCDPASDTPRRVDEGARPIEWSGPSWMPYGSPWPPGWVPDASGNHVYHPELDPRRSYQCPACGRSFFWDEDRPCPACGTPAGELR